jgi:hypothetical protein
MNKWMQPEDYERYKAANDTPVFSDHYRLEYRINGKSYAW